MKDSQRMYNTIRDPAPCKDCPERFSACSDSCPKDLRGERGYKAWHDEIERVKNAKNKHLEKHAGEMKYMVYGGMSNGKK